MVQCLRPLALRRSPQRAEAAALDGGSPAAAAGPVLSGAVAQRALHSLQEAVEVALQFLEQQAPAQADAGPGTSPDAGPSDLLRCALLVAALRALARCGGEWRHMARRT